MAKSRRKKCLSFSSFRRRQKGNDRRFCIIWINRMVNKQVEKRIAELRSELLLMNQVLREEMVIELQEELRELMPEEARESPLHYTRLEQEQRMTSRWLRKIEEQYKAMIKEDDDDEAKSLNFSETSFDTNSIFIMAKPTKRELEESSKTLLDVSSDDDTSDDDTSSQPAKCEQEENQVISSKVAAADTSQLVKEESSRNPLHAYPSFMPEELRCEDARAQVDRTKEEEALLMETQWKEWMDKQEMRGNHDKVKPADRMNTEKQGGAATPVPKKQNAKQNTKQKENVNRVDTMKKIKTYLSDIFNPYTFNKWERFEDED